MLTSIELCAGGGGQAIGLEMAGFAHLALVENDRHACETLRLNRHEWNVVEGCLRVFDAKPFKGQVDLIAGGVPCPPFSHAGKQLGTDDERNLFDEALRIVEESKPKAVMLENVRGLLDPKFDEYRRHISNHLENLGYWSDWKLLNASDFGVCQLRPRVVMVALRTDYKQFFKWPTPNTSNNVTVGTLLEDLMGANGWPHVKSWVKKANSIAPTLVGGSKKHGGPDLGPTRAKRAWAELSVNGHNVMYEAPEADFVGKAGLENMPYLTLRMAARIQGFPDTWEFFGTKTHAYRQIGNAFPPPVATAVGTQIRLALLKQTKPEKVIKHDQQQLAIGF